MISDTSQKKRVMQIGWKRFLQYDYYFSILSGERHFPVFFVALIYSACVTAMLLISYRQYYPYIQNLDKKIDQALIELVPDNVEVIIKNGTAKSNVTEPYYWTVSQEKLNALLGVESDKNTISKVRLLTIDTKGKAEDFESYQSYALLTEKSFVYYNDGEIQINSLRNMSDFTLNKKIILTTYHDFSSKYHIFNIIKILFYASPFLILILVMITILLIYLYLALLVYIMARILRVSPSFKAIYKYTFAITIIPTFIWEVVGAIPGAAPYTLILDSLHTMVLLAICYVGLQKLKVQQTKPV